MALKVARVPAYGVKFTNSLKGKVVGRAYLYVMTNDLHKRPFGLFSLRKSWARSAASRCNSRCQSQNRALKPLPRIFRPRGFPHSVQRPRLRNLSRRWACNFAAFARCSLQNLKLTLRGLPHVSQMPRARFLHR